MKIKVFLKIQVHWEEKQCRWVGVLKDWGVPTTFRRHCAPPRSRNTLN